MLIEREREKFNYFGKTNYTSIYRAFHLKTQETVCKYYERIIFIFIFVCFNDTSMLCACDVWGNSRDKKRIVEKGNEEATRHTKSTRDNMRGEPMRGDTISDKE